MKKLLSIFLATAMLISLIPAAFASDTEAEKGIKVVYDFTNELISENKMTSYQYTSKGEIQTGYKMQGTTLNYDSTSGFWEYMCNSNDDDQLQTTTSYIRPYPAGNCLRATVYGRAHIETEKAAWIAFSIYVPKTGVYDLDIKVNYRNKTQPYVSAYIFKSASVSSVDGKLIDQVKAGLTEPNVLSTGKVDKTINNEETLSLGEDVKLDEGEHYFVYNPISPVENFGVSSYMDLLSLTLTEGDGTKSVPMISSLTVDGNQVTATAAKMSNGDTATDVTYSYAVAADDTDLAEVDANTGVVTGKADGTATIIATATKDGYSSSKSIEVAVTAPAGEPEEDEPLVDEFIKEEEKEDISDSYVEATVTGLELNGNTIVAEENTDGTYNLTAPKKEEKFLYWAMGLVGNKRIVSFSETLENYVPEGNYRNYLVPVYEGDVDASKKEFYNQNGQLIPDATENTAVSMPGYGGTSSWKQYGDTNIYVADYGKTEEQRDEVTVTVVGGKGTDTVLFGETVTCIADDEDANGNPFKCWKKTIGDTTEIVSIDSTYKFRAWEKCTVTAVYEEHTPISTAMKIIIDDFVVGSETGVMAEFIGLDDAVEKGIMFTAPGEEEATKLAMTTKDNQFTVIADAAGTYEGYAIVGNAADGYSLITDGLYTK